MAEGSKSGSRSTKRWLGFILLAVGLPLFLRPPHFLNQRLDYGLYWLGASLVVLGIFLFAEGLGVWSAFLKGKQKTAASKDGPATPSPPSEPSKGETEKNHNDRMLVLIGVALVVAVGVCLWFGSLWQASNQAKAQVDKDLIALLGRPTSTSGTTDPDARSAALEKALIYSLTHPPKSSENFPWLVLLLIGGAALLLFTTKEHPSAAPVVGVIPVATAAIKYADHLSKFCLTGFLWIVIVSLIIAVSLMLAGLLKKDTGEDAGPHGEKKQVVSFITMSFSVLILIWTFILVGWSKDCPGCTPKPKITDCAQCPACAPCPASSPRSELKVTPLPGPSFGRANSSDPKGIKQLEESLKKNNPQKGDLLLLLGSSDCTRYSNGNESLAKQRAKTVADNLPTLSLNGASEDSDNTLSQYNRRCREEQDLRRVFPFLIQPKSTERH